MKDDLNNLKVAVIPHEFLLKMEIEINELKTLLRKKTEEEKNDEWIESTKVPKILGVTRKTYQSWRDKRLLSFSQIGSKIYVKRADIEKFMNSHYIEAVNSK